MRKRSAYRPKPVLLDTMAHVKSGMAKADTGGGAILTLRLTNHTSLEQLRKGLADRQNITDLIHALNMTEALGMLQLGGEYATFIREGQDALLAMSRRGVATGQFTCYAKELVAINTAMAVHDAQLDVATVKQIETGVKIENTVLVNKRARKILETT